MSTKTLLPLASLVGAAFCLGGCFIVQNPYGTDDHKPAMTGKHGDTTVVRDPDAGSTVTLRVGEKLTVQLASNLTTGYGWRTKEKKGDSLTTVGPQPEYIPDSAPDDAVSVGGHSLFRFKAKRPGTETLRFTYVRPYALDKVAKEVRFQVVVQ